MSESSTVTEDDSLGMTESVEVSKTTIKFARRRKQQKPKQEEHDKEEEVTGDSHKKTPPLSTEAVRILGMLEKVIAGDSEEMGCPTVSDIRSELLRMKQNSTLPQLPVRRVAESLGEILRRGKREPTEVVEVSLAFFTLASSEEVRERCFSEELGQSVMEATRGVVESQLVKPNSYLVTVVAPTDQEDADLDEEKDSQEVKRKPPKKKRLKERSKLWTRTSSSDLSRCWT